ncbi:MAG: threonylcarbamoyl-AMP synthase [Bacteroidetes bacterium]|nr:threonylcarbamoyl-AMP synthase [Bacteroidota bacterium]
MASIGIDLIAAAQHLKNGDCVGIPTETVYGLAANALDANACLKIFEIKERPTFDPLIVHVKDIAEIEKYVSVFPNQAKLLFERFSPGPITVVLPKKSIIPDIVTSGLDTVGMRIPNHTLTQQLLNSLDFPLAAPSANPFGYVSPTQAQHVNAQLGQKIKYILDGGECKVGIESTIVGFENNHPVIYRLGGLTIEEIEHVIGSCKVQLNNSSNPVAPGQIASHYAPKKKLVLVDSLQDAQIDVTKKVGAIVYKSYSDKIEKKNQLILTPGNNLQEAGKNLFNFLRKIDELDVDIVYAEKVPNDGIGKAINDRLFRASTK